MKAPQYRREYIHHVRTLNGVSTYQIRSGMGDESEVLAAVVVTPDAVHCTTCNLYNCDHAAKIKAKRMASPSGSVTGGMRD